MHVSDALRDRLIDAAPLADVVQQFIPLTPRGKLLKGNCPKCGGKKLDLHMEKGVLRCWNCMDQGIGSPLKFLMEFEGMDFRQAMEWLASRQGRSLEELVAEENGEALRAKRKARPQGTFRDRQLRESGITDEAQKDFQDAGKSRDGLLSQMEISRFQSATVTPHWDVDPHGDDMVLHYLGLDGAPMMYRAKGGKMRPFIRVRYENPELHTDKEGNPMKYQQPYGSGVHVWLPALLRRWYNEGRVMTTLHLDEGEKKATKKCMHGMLTVGLMGINNLAGRNEQGTQMPDELQRIVKANGVERVVLTFDADWQDLGGSENAPVDGRPLSFRAAAIRFKEHFRALQAQGIDLELYLAHVRPNGAGAKGVDDLLAGPLKGREDELREDYDAALLDPNGDGKWIKAYKITTWSDAQLSKLWGLDTPARFFELHGETLRARKVQTFTFRGKKWRWDQEAGDFRLEQQLMPEEQYWREIKREKEDSSWTEYKFDYQGFRVFLRNRGIGRIRRENGEFEYVRRSGRVLDIVTPDDVADFVLDHTEDLGQMRVLGECLLPGRAAYLGPTNLKSTYYLPLSPVTNTHQAQHLFFRETYWRITAEGIEAGPLDTLPGDVWKHQIIDFEPGRSAEGLIEVERQGDAWAAKRFDERLLDSDFFRYLYNTSDLGWRDRLEAEPPGKPRVLRDQDAAEATATFHQLLSKLTAIGYLLHRHHNPAVTKLVLCMDAKMSAVGASNGRTGKSIFADALAKVTPMFMIDGQEYQFERKPFLFDGLKETHGIINVDDANPHMRWEFWFSKLTRGVEANVKGKSATRIPLEAAQKVLISTNHAPVGQEMDSSRDRIFQLSFSDWYSAGYKPGRDFGRMLFTAEWPHEQWLLAYELMATCVQLYLRHGLIEAPNHSLRLRVLRQQMGEEFLDWANDYLHAWMRAATEEAQRVEKLAAWQDFKERTRSKIGVTLFKRNVHAWVQFHGYVLNPNKPPVDAHGIGGDFKSNGKEYFWILDPRKEGVPASLALNPQPDDDDTPF